MRFEGKNSQMKKYLHGNFKNVPYSVASRHQEWLCSVLSAPGEDAPFLSLGDKYSGTELEYIHTHMHIIYVRHTNYTAKPVNVNDEIGKEIAQLCSIEEAPMPLKLLE